MGYRKGEERLHKAMEFIISFQHNNGYPPHVRDLCAGAGVRSPSHAHKILDELESRDFILRTGNKSRAIRIMESAYEFINQIPLRLEETLAVPILGRIVASEPIPMPDAEFSYFDAESSVNVLRSSLPERENPQELFALEVQGDSMIDSMVNDGDVVILRRTRAVENGDMAAVWLKDKQETTLKHFYRKNDEIILRPANPTMQDIKVENPEQLELQGKVVMVIRQY